MLVGIESENITMSINRDIISIHRRIREIQRECSIERIGVIELAKRRGCNFDVVKNEDGKLGNAVHFLVGNNDINCRSPDCVDCELTT
jgi:hypothetical protein